MLKKLLLILTLVCLGSSAIIAQEESTIDNSEVIDRPIEFG